MASTREQGSRTGSATNRRVSSDNGAVGNRRANSDNGAVGNRRAGSGNRVAGNRRDGSSTAANKRAEAQKAYEAQVEAYVQEELRKREKSRKLLIFLCSVVAIGCLLYVGFYSYEDYRTKANYEQMAQMKAQTPPPQAGNPAEEDLVINYTEDAKETPEILEEYKNLFNMNKKLIGWLKIDDTIIDYPVMQTTDNEYYLDHNINQEKDRNGALFLDKDCDVLAPSTNLIIYGHHMKSGRMFGNLDDYASEKYYKEHSIIQFDTIYEKGTYEVMYVFRSQVYSEAEVVFKYYQFIDCYSEQEFDSYMQEMAAMSLYDTGVTAEYGDRLLTLSTCDSTIDDGRFVVVAKRID